MQRISLKNGAIAFVDYAHTPDALEKALQACREIMKEQGNKSAKLICLFGCGGDRDRTKRPEMGEIAARLSDLVVITDDNPRTEDPASIIQEISNGVQKEHSHKVIMKPNRTLALVLAIEKSIAGDIILVAGKGHEDYQVIGKTKYHHDDVEILRNYA
jgi:UDP-N-acetylmuramyl tripeptide synthase